MREEKGRNELLENRKNESQQYQREEEGKNGLLEIRKNESQQYQRAEKGEKNCWNLECVKISRWFTPAGISTDVANVRRAWEKAWR